MVDATTPLLLVGVLAVIYLLLRLMSLKDD